MNLTQLLQSAQGQQVLGQLAKQFNMDTAQASAAAAQLLPAIQSGMRNRIQQDPSSLNQIFGEKAQELEGYVKDDKVTADASQLTDTGNAILGQIFGSKEVSREVASRASANTGLDVGALKSMLPILASLAGSQVASAGRSGGQQSSGGLLSGLLGGLLGGKKQGNSQVNMSAISSLLDADGDGSIADDLMGMASKFFK
ncbi:MAG: DUF937 domain-containing protein [Alphaproteobacteria bacterium]